MGGNLVINLLPFIVAESIQRKPGEKARKEAQAQNTFEHSERQSKPLTPWLAENHREQGARSHLCVGDVGVVEHLGPVFVLASHDHSVKWLISYCCVEEAGAFVCMLCAVSPPGQALETLVDETNPILLQGACGSM